jgi:Carboxypeptidase regulatory-like domain
MSTTRCARTFIWLSFAIFPYGAPARAQALSQPPSPSATDRNGPADSPASAQSSTAASPASGPQTLGSVRGKVIDQSGAVVVGAHVKLTRGSQSQEQPQEVVTNGDGLFSFSDIPVGPFQVEVTLAGFAPKTASGSIQAGSLYAVPQITLTVATANTEVQVVPPTFEIAEEQIKEQEKQRVLGVFPNFYVTYVHDAAPLSPKQKFELAWKSTIDPVNFAVTAGVAGLEQSQDQFNGYGQGVQGYAKRYGAAFADSTVNTFVGGAILPTVLKQDPRYFYKGTGSTRSRVLYAIASAVICKGDNGRWQPNYSGILGNLAAGGISNIYYSGKDRDGVWLTFENTFIGIGAAAATNLLQEFVIRKFTPGASGHSVPKPQNAVAKLWTKVIHDGD